MGNNRNPRNRPFRQSFHPLVPVLETYYKFKLVTVDTACTQMVDISGALVIRKGYCLQAMAHARHRSIVLPMEQARSLPLLLFHRAVII